jgi:hypothetical protein
MSFKTISLVIAVVLAATGCAATQPVTSAAAPANAASASPVAPAPSSATASAGGAITGAIKPGSKFSKVKIGMQFEQVNDLIGTPNSLSRNETGKRWIPFYFGSDVLRLQASYKGEGCLTYTGGNQFGSSGGELIAITVEPAGCI